MTVKFRDPLSAQACLLVRACASFFIPGSFPTFRKWTVDSLLDAELKPPSSQESNDFNEVGEQMRSKERGLKLRRSVWMTLLNGY